MTTAERHVLAIGGFATDPSLQDPLPQLIAHTLTLSGTDEPRVCVLNTAAGDEPGAFVRMYARLGAAGARASHLQLFPMPNVPDPAAHLLSQDVIFVGGGSVANMLAVWRVHHLDDVMREAWEAGIVLAGVSAGAICWFGGGTTDSFGPVLRPFTAGLGLLPGSYCPHYSGEPTRRPAYQALVADGTLPAGIACDDGAAAHFVGTELAEVVAERPRGSDDSGSEDSGSEHSGSEHSGSEDSGSEHSDSESRPAAYRVQPDGSGGAAEELIAARLLP